MKSLYYRLAYAVIKLILIFGFNQLRLLFTYYLSAMGKCHSVLFRFLKNVAIKSNFQNYRFDTITSLTYLPWFFLSPTTIAEILKHEHSVLSRSFGNEVVLIYLHQPLLFLKRRSCQLPKKPGSLCHYPLALKLSPNVSLVSSSPQIKTVHFCPVIRCGQLTVTILMSWKIVTTYMKLVFFFRNHNLPLKGEEQGAKNKPLYSISS